MILSVPIILQSVYIDTQALTHVFVQTCHLRLSQYKEITHCVLLTHSPIIVLNCLCEELLFNVGRLLVG